MSFADWMDIGIMPGQHHQQGVLPHLRMQMVMGRVVNVSDPAEDDSPEGSMVEYGKDRGLGTLGDFHPTFYWPPSSRARRGTGSWAQAFAAMTVTGGGGGFKGGRTGHKPKASGMLPLATGGLRTDSRYRQKFPGWPKCFNTLPRGTLMTVMAGTLETAQQEVMVHGDPRLIAANIEGPGTAGTLVVDMQPNGEYCMDDESDEPGKGGRHARLQSLVRVIAMPKDEGIEALGTGVGNMLAINYATSDFDKLGGFGAVWIRMQGGGGGTGPITGGPGKGPITGPRSGGRGGTQQKGGPTTSGGGGGGGGGGGVIPDNNGGLGGGLTGGGNDEDLSGLDPCASGKFSKKPKGGHGVAFMAQDDAFGPIKGGSGEGDKHFIGVDRDGNAMVSAHISANAYIYKDADKDGPWMFEGLWPKPDPQPLMTVCHITWDKDQTHPHVLGSRPGKWRVWAEDTKCCPPTTGGGPPPTGGPVTSGPTTPGGPSPGGPITPGPGSPGGPRSPRGTNPGGPITPPAGPGTPPRGGGWRTTGGPGAPGAPQPGGPRTPGGGAPGAPGPNGGPRPGKGKGPRTPRGGGSPGAPDPVEIIGDPIPDDPGLGPDVPGGPTTGPRGGGEPSTSGKPKPRKPARPIDPWWRDDMHRSLPPWIRSLTNTQGDSRSGTQVADINAILNQPVIEVVDEDGNTVDPRGTYGVVEKVGGPKGEPRWSVHHPYQESYAALAFRPQVWAEGIPSVINNPNMHAGKISADDRVRPNVLQMDAFGAMDAALGDYDYVEVPHGSHLRGGTGHGGVLFHQPRHTMEDFFGIQSDVDVRAVDANLTTGYVAAGPGVGFALGTPNQDGTLADTAVIIKVDPTDTTDNPLSVRQINSSSAEVELIGAMVSQSSGEIKVTLGGTAGAVAPFGTTAQRAASPDDGAFRVNSTTGRFEFYDGSSWVGGASESEVNTVATDAFLLDGSQDMTAGAPGFAGTALLPGWSFAGDLNTGMWHPGADAIGWSVGGAQHLWLISSGRFGVGGSPGQLIDAQQSSSGASVSVRVQNTAAGATSSARQLAKVASGGGDAYFLATEHGGGPHWSFGKDQSGSDRFVVCNDNSLSTALFGIAVSPNPDAFFLGGLAVGASSGPGSSKLYVNQDSGVGAVPCLELDQDDVDVEFIEFDGTSNTGGAGSIDSSSGEAGACSGKIRITVNGTTRWLRFYADET